MGRYTVIYRYEIDYDHGNFLKNAESETFTGHICKKLNLDTDRNQIDYIKQGSTVVGGTVSADN